MTIEHLISGSIINNDYFNKNNYRLNFQQEEYQLYKKQDDNAIQLIGVRGLDTTPVTYEVILSFIVYK